MDQGAATFSPLWGASGFLQADCAERESDDAAIGPIADIRWSCAARQMPGQPERGGTVADEPVLRFDQGCERREAPFGESPCPQAVPVGEQRDVLTARIAVHIGHALHND